MNERQIPVKPRAGGPFARDGQKRPDDPSEEEIARLAAEIREEWSEYEMFTRLAEGERPLPWRAPLIITRPNWVNAPS